MCTVGRGLTWPMHVRYKMYLKQVSSVENAEERYLKLKQQGISATAKTDENIVVEKNGREDGKTERVQLCKQ